MDRSFSGSAQTEKIINLSFRNSGIITDLNIRPGQKVKKDDLLAKLDNVQARLSYEKARTQVNSSKSQMNTAKLSFDRVSSLYEKGSASLSDFENAKNSFRTSEQSYEAAKRGLDIQAEQIKFGYIYSPASGTIASVNSEVDENVSPGQVIATLNAGKTMEISLGLPESFINNISENMPVDIKFTALKEGEFKGKVKEISPSIDNNTATYPVKISVINPSNKIKSGMAANVTFLFDNNKEDNNKLFVPANAVGEDINGNFVFLLKGDKDIVTVKKKKVTIGKLTTSGFEIKEGLNKGDKIAVAGLQTLLDGQKVRRREMRKYIIL
ncbi:MAG: efflux transporter periplasmic adaptor subunit [Candidatus Cloacimonadota bacterium]|nr:MAG: efflux transporter periplasmic adaptor subunit [Candidatus Cloacimonadota bacterium]